MKNKIVLESIVLLLTLVCAQITFAEDVIVPVEYMGNTESENWHRAYAGTINSSGISQDLDESLNPSASTSSSDGNLIAQSSFSGLHGYLNSSAEGLSSQVFQGINNEMYFETDNGNPAEIAFNFNVDLAISVLDDQIPLTFENQSGGTSGSASLELRLFADHFVVDSRAIKLSSTLVENDDGTTYNSYSAALYEFGNDEAIETWEDFTELVINEEIQLSTSGFVGTSRGVPWHYPDLDGNIREELQTGLVQSGAYLPYTIQLQANVYSEGSLEFDWLNTIALDQENPMDVYQMIDGQRVKLLESQYTLVNAQDFDNNTTPVPEPAAILLFGSGLVGAFIKRRKA